MSTETGLRARLARKALGLLDPSELERHYRGAFALHRVEPFPGHDVIGTDRLSASITEAVGIDFREGAQLERLSKWAERGPGMFNAIRSDQDINRVPNSHGAVDNPYYSTPDAEVYASMIFDLMPARIVEVGGGYSTLVARHAVSQLGTETEIVVVDPEPRTKVRAAATSTVTERAETLDMSQLVVGAGDILFIDSSHVVRTGGDVPHLLLEVVPRLDVGAVVHLHDIYLPYGYASEYARRLWTEQHMLQALLTGSSRYEVLFSTHMMSRLHLDAMRAAFGPAVGTTPIGHGQSFWFTVR